MADVEVSYKGSTIGSLSASGGMTLETEGCYCEDDIGITYTKPLYQLGEYAKTAQYEVIVNNGHVKITAVANFSSTLIGLRDLRTVNSLPSWFIIPAGSTVKINYTNVVNTSERTWNANFRKANASTSLGFGIGDGKHLSGESITIIPTTDQDVGGLFVFMVSMATGDILEFDVDVFVDGVRVL